jgi:hypothetical protein
MATELWCCNRHLADQGSGRHRLLLITAPAPSSPPPPAAPVRCSGQEQDERTRPALSALPQTVPRILANPPISMWRSSPPRPDPSCLPPLDVRGPSPHGYHIQLRHLGPRLQQPASTACQPPCASLCRWLPGRRLSSLACPARTAELATTAAYRPSHATTRSIGGEGSHAGSCRICVSMRQPAPSGEKGCSWEVRAMHNVC